MISGFLLRIGLKNSRETVRANTAFVSILSGEYAFAGPKAMHTILRLWIIIERQRQMAKDKLKPIHPGEVLDKEFLKPMGLSQNALARNISVPPRRINEIVLGKRRITADTALRLARYFGNSPHFWLGLQEDYDLDMARDALNGRLEKEITPISEAG
jgi:addiction module HigA family antidote